MNEYAAVVRTLKPVIVQGKSIDNNWDPEASPLAKQICYGVLRNYFRLDAIVGKLVKKPIPQKNIEVKILLLAGLYSIDEINRPAYASVNEAVEAAASLDRAWAKGLINGVLRNYLRSRDEIDRAIGPDEVNFNHPAWLRLAIESAWPQDASSILAANNEKAPMTLRVNASRISRDDYLSLLSDSGHNGQPGLLTPVSIYLDEPTGTNELPGFEEGFVSVQDEASQLAAGILLPEAGDGSGEMILDACSAPGGKTCHLLELQAEANLTALDIDRKRMNQVRQNLSRAGLDCETVIADLLSWKTDAKFDRILLDAPCSATGIIRRHPDIKLLRRESDIAKLVSAQTRLLQAAWRLLKEGGILVYSTCSILPAENEDVVQSFFNDSGINAEVMPISSEWGIPTGTGRQLLPKAGAHDGFFYARIRKRN
jgi:16S rRNA (cytosine967-C5)-methyltransferase